VHRVHDTSSSFARIVIGEVGRIDVTLRGAGAAESPPWQIGLAAPGSALDSARSPLFCLEQDLHLAALTDLSPGSYEIWLEEPLPGQPDVWRRVGRPKLVVLDAEHPRARLEWDVPR
jgi:hypothetical protein